MADALLLTNGWGGRLWNAMLAEVPFVFSLEGKKKHSPFVKRRVYECDDEVLGACDCPVLGVSPLALRVPLSNYSAISAILPPCWQ